MIWYRQATSRYLSRCCRCSASPYIVTRPLGVLAFTCNVTVYRTGLWVCAVHCNYAPLREFLPLDFLLSYRNELEYQRILYQIYTFQLGYPIGMFKALQLIVFPVRGGLTTYLL